MITQLLVLKNKALIILVFLIPFLEAYKHSGSRNSSWTFLVVQWLRLCAPTAGCSSLTFGPSFTCHNVWPNKKHFFFKFISFAGRKEKSHNTLCILEKGNLSSYVFFQRNRLVKNDIFFSHLPKKCMVFKILLFHKQRKIHTRFLNYHFNAECTHKSFHDTKGYTLKSNSL